MRTPHEIRDDVRAGRCHKLDWNWRDDARRPHYIERGLTHARLEAMSYQALALLRLWRCVHTRPCSCKPSTLGASLAQLVRSSVNTKPQARRRLIR